MTDQPARPYRDFMQQVAARTMPKLAAAKPITSPHKGAPDELRAQVIDAVEAAAPALIELSHSIHARPELCFEEHHAVAAVGELMERFGQPFTPGTWSLPTAFHASCGSGGPRVAVVAEYDALPEIGHACGHNIICATAVGAYLALASMQESVPGTVELIGSPAEEGGGGKELIARAGGFDGLDAALMIHPAGVDLAEGSWLGKRSVDATYHGIASHASALPFLGLNALDAAVTAYNGISQLRQHMLPGDRVHGVITDGGDKPNIVPERAAVSYYVRSADPHTLAELSARVDAILRSAATATGTTVDIVWDNDPAYIPVRSNHPLAARYSVNMSARGRFVLPDGIMPDLGSGSTDMGNVSVRVPSIHPMLAVAPGDAVIHSREFTGHTNGAAADKGVVDGAIGLALTALDFLCDEGLREDVRAEFLIGGGPIDVEKLFG